MAPGRPHRSRLPACANSSPDASFALNRMSVTGLLVALVLAIVLPALLGAAHALSYARIPVISVSLVREVMLVTPGARPLTDL